MYVCMYVYTFVYRKHLTNSSKKSPMSIWKQKEKEHGEKGTEGEEERGKETGGEKGEEER